MATTLTIILLSIGVFFLVVATIGFIRFPDVYSRLHVTGVMDTLGAPLILLAAAIHLGFSLDSAKLILTIIFLYVTSPLVGHLLAKSAFESDYGQDPLKHKARHITK
jgi:multicomponent Na+:H+ antiporter subunit G